MVAARTGEHILNILEAVKANIIDAILMRRSISKLLGQHVSPHGRERLLESGPSYRRRPSRGRNTVLRLLPP